jgi:hypothetical protein
MRGRASAMALDQGWVVQAGILAAHRVADGIRQVAGALPLARRADMAVAADLVDAPVDLEPVIVRIAKFDGDLTTGAAPAGKVDVDPVLAKMVVRARDPGRPPPPPRRASRHRKRYG